MFRNAPAIAEAERYVRIEFSFQTSETGTISIHKGDCGTEMLILGLKHDFSSMFGTPENQEWYHRVTKLDNNKTLRDYSLDGRDGHSTYKIYVKQIKPASHHR